MTTSINKSLLSKNNFRLLIDKVPNVEFFVKSVNIPGLTFTETVLAAGIGLDAFFPGDKIQFETLSVSFLVDEDLQNLFQSYDRALLVNDTRRKEPKHPLGRGARKKRQKSYR